MAREPTGEELLFQFCAVLQDRLADAGHYHEVTWEIDRNPGIVNIHIGNVESYSIYVNTNEWVVFYKA